MAVNFIDTLSDLCLVILFLMTFMSFILTVMGVVMATLKRKPEIGFWKAFISKNVMFKPELYRDEALVWRKVHILGFVGVFLFVFLAFLLSILGDFFLR